jgi:hypothetical protein
VELLTSQFLHPQVIPLSSVKVLSSAPCSRTLSVRVLS